MRALRALDFLERVLAQLLCGGALAGRLLGEVRFVSESDIVDRAAHQVELAAGFAPLAGLPMIVGKSLRSGRGCRISGTGRG